jgi:hypothetical protein
VPHHQALVVAEAARPVISPSRLLWLSCLRGAFQNESAASIQDVGERKKSVAASINPQNSAIEPLRSQRPQRIDQGFMASENFTPQGNDYEKGIIPKLFSLRSLRPLR